MTHRAYGDERETNPIPFIAASAPNAHSPTTRRTRRGSSRAREEDVAVLEYWARVRAGIERAPRPGAEAAENKRRCAHLESHLATVLAPERREDDDCDGDASSGAPRQLGRTLDEEELSMLEARAGTAAAATVKMGVPLSDEDVRMLRSGSMGAAAVSSAAATMYGEPYSMPFAPAGEYAYEDAPPAAPYAQEHVPEEEAFFEYGVHELPRHMKDWYEPPTEEYGSFVTNRQAAGAYDSAWRAEERRFNTVRNLKSHQLW